MSRAFAATYELAGGHVRCRVTVGALERSAEAQAAIDDNLQELSLLLGAEHVASACRGASSGAALQQYEAVLQSCDRLRLKLLPRAKALQVLQSHMVRAAQASGLMSLRPQRLHRHTNTHARAQSLKHFVTCLLCLKCLLHMLWTYWFAAGPPAEASCRGCSRPRHATAAHCQCHC